MAIACGPWRDGIDKVTSLKFSKPENWVEVMMDRRIDNGWKSNLSPFLSSRVEIAKSGVDWTPIPI